MTYREKVMELCRRYGVSPDAVMRRLKADEYLRQARTVTEFNSCLDELPFPK